MTRSVEDRWTRIAREAKAINDHMAKVDPVGMAAVRATVKRRVECVKLATAVRKGRMS